MDQLEVSDLQELFEHAAQPCVSIFMPAVRAGAEIQQNSIRFKNLLREAEEQLEAAGMRSPDVKDFLKPAREEILLDEMFWQQQSDGLAVFASPEMLRTYRLPLRFDEQVTVGRKFNLKPLFEHFQNDGHFFILALSQDEVRLLEGTKYSVEEVDIDALPENLADALKLDAEKQTQFRSISGHTYRNAGGGRQGVIFHGHGEEQGDEKNNILRYFHHVDEALQEYLADERAPLILAGVDYLLPIYQEANEYNHLMEEHISGNPEELRAETLHGRAWKIVEPIFAQELEDVLARYKREEGQQSGLASENLAEIVRAAHAGRIESLIIEKDAELWGSFDPGSDRVEAHPGRTPTSDDLINTAAIYTFRGNGKVYTVGQGQSPGGSPVTAIFRY